MLINELIFWTIFIFLNGIHYLINYIFNIHNSSFWPFISDYKSIRQLGISFSVNQDIFRYVVEISLFLILSRMIDLSILSVPFIIFYFLILLFNLYQYSFRKIYEYEPNFYNDSKLIKSGIAIVWHESKWKVIFYGVLAILGIIGFSFGIITYLEFAQKTPPNFLFYVFLSFWAFPLFRVVQKKRFYINYPIDLYLRYHFATIEIIENMKRSLVNRKIYKKKIGKEFYEKRKVIDFDLQENPPNIHFIFIESYGAYFFKEATLALKSHEKFNNFSDGLKEKGWQSRSNFSVSPTTGGQSWLTYSSFLFGLKMGSNTYFENYLTDPYFNKSNSLLRILKNLGYKNYNLNPINPIKGINVPYDEMKDFYSIDKWILNDILNYKGDVFGFGECPPDQYAMNYTMELIKKEKQEPYTFFYLTKNSHTPFISPKMVEDWRSLNHSNGSTHIHRGFLKAPEKEDYFDSICYQFENIGRFILDHGQDNDIFYLIGDHQPPVLSEPEKYGFFTPTHVISKNSDFLKEFESFGFQEDIGKCENTVKHEGIYSIFLRAFMKNYGKNFDQLPDYEPDGLQI